MDSTIQLRNSLISKIQQTEDIDFLKALQALFDSPEQELYALNTAQEESIALSRNEIENGRFIQNAKAISDLRQWLEKQ